MPGQNVYNDQARQTLRQPKRFKYHWNPQQQKIFQSDYDSSTREKKSMEPKKIIKTAFIVKAPYSPRNNNSVIEAVEVNEQKTVYRLQISDLV